MFSSELVDKGIIFLANLYESVALHSNILPIILKFIPFNIALFSSILVANAV